MAVTAKGLPESWTKPVVKSVLLPAHAQATRECICEPVIGTTPAGSINFDGATEIVSELALDLRIDGICPGAEVYISQFLKCATDTDCSIISDLDIEPDSIFNDGTTAGWFSDKLAISPREVLRIDYKYACPGDYLVIYNRYYLITGF